MCVSSSRAADVDGRALEEEDSEGLVEVKAPEDEEAEEAEEAEEEEAMLLLLLVNIDMWASPKQARRIIEGVGLLVSGGEAAPVLEH